MTPRDRYVCTDLLRLLLSHPDKDLRAYADALSSLISAVSPYNTDAGGDIWKPKLSVCRENIRHTCRTMEVGDAFVIPYEHMGALSARQVVHTQQERLNRRFTTRQMTTGLKVWRTA